MKWFHLAVALAPNDLPARQMAATWALNYGDIDFAKEQAEAILRIEEADNRLPEQDRKYRGSHAGQCFAAWLPYGKKTGRKRRTIFRRCSTILQPISRLGTTSPWP